MIADEQNDSGGGASELVGEPLDSSESVNLKTAMNKRLEGADQVTLVESDGSFETGRGRRSWMEI